jgi:hypothetical protein
VYRIVNSGIDPFGSGFAVSQCSKDTPRCSPVDALNDDTLLGPVQAHRFFAAIKICACLQIRELFIKDGK